MKKTSTANQQLRTMALIALAAGSAGSEGLMLYVGHPNPSYILLVLFTGWDLSPFIGLVVAHGLSKHWNGWNRATLHIVTLVVALGSLAIYIHAVLRPTNSAPAFPFLAVPFGAWLLMLIVGGFAVLKSRRT